MTSSITESRKKSGWKIKLNTVFSETTLVETQILKRSLFLFLFLLVNLINFLSNLSFISTNHSTKNDLLKL